MSGTVVRVLCEAADCGALLEVQLPTVLNSHGTPYVIVRCEACHRLLEVPLPTSMSQPSYSGEPQRQRGPGMGPPPYQYQGNVQQQQYILPSGSYGPGPPHNMPQQRTGHGMETILRTGQYQSQPASHYPMQYGTALDLQQRQSSNLKPASPLVPAHNNPQYYASQSEMYSTRAGNPGLHVGGPVVPLDLSQPAPMQQQELLPPPPTTTWGEPTHSIQHSTAQHGGSGTGSGSGSGGTQAAVEGGSGGHPAQQALVVDVNAPTAPSNTAGLQESRPHPRTFSNTSDLAMLRMLLEAEDDDDEEPLDWLKDLDMCADMNIEEHQHDEQQQVFTAQHSVGSSSAADLSPNNDSNKQFKHVLSKTRQQVAMVLQVNSPTDVQAGNRFGAGQYHPFISSRPAVSPYNPQAEDNQAKKQRKRKGSTKNGPARLNPYSEFVRAEMRRLREENPSLDHRTALQQAATNWASSRPILGATFPLKPSTPTSINNSTSPTAMAAAAAAAVVAAAARLKPHAQLQQLLTHSPQVGNTTTTDVKMSDDRQPDTGNNKKGWTAAALIPCIPPWQQCTVPAVLSTTSSVPQTAPGCCGPVDKAEPLSGSTATTLTTSTTTAAADNSDNDTLSKQACQPCQQWTATNSNLATTLHHASLVQLALRLAHHVLPAFTASSKPTAPQEQR